MQKIIRSLNYIFVVLLILTCSCTDHDLPVAYPVIETVVEYSQRTTDGLEYNFGVNFLEMGNVPIVEYGVLYAYSLGRALELLDGTLLAAKAVFTGTPRLGITKQWSKVPSIGIILWPVNLHRAYAKLSDGTVVYGKVYVNPNPL
jgi:hypothetical protein